MSGLIPLRVLIIEDCPDDRDVLLLRLCQAGFNPDAVCVDTLKGIEDELAHSDWQIVFSDFDLPGFDGLFALNLVRSRNADVPFFIVSGVMDEEQAVTAMRAGAQDYFFKGKLARLGPAVHRELEESEQRRRQKEAEAALDRDRNILRHDRIRFADVMSHELRTPLNIINVAATMLERYDARMDTAGRRERVAEIQAAVARMTRIIDKFLLASRLELRRWELRSEVIDLRAWIDEFLVHNVTENSQRERVRIRFGELPSEVALDPRVLEIALQNLLSNALKYSPPDSAIDLSIAADDAGRLRFMVSDQGIGIPHSDLPHLFEGFYRGSNVGEVQGTGLGLAIAKGCMDLHGGTIEVESVEGRGTSVSITLPDWLQLRVQYPSGAEAQVIRA